MPEARRVIIGGLRSYVLHFDEMDQFKEYVRNLVKKTEGDVRFGYPSGCKEEYKDIDDIPFPIQLTGSVPPKDMGETLGVNFESQGYGHYKALHVIACDVEHFPEEISFHIDYWFEDEIDGQSSEDTLT